MSSARPVRPALIPPLCAIRTRLTLGFTSQSSATCVHLSRARQKRDRPADLLKLPLRAQIMSKFYLSHHTFLALKDMPLKSNMRTLLETLSASTEFGSYRFRQGEKSVRPRPDALGLVAR